MSVPKLRTPDLTQEIAINAKAGISTYIAGPPGVGKSQIVHQFAKTIDAKVYELRANLYDPVDVRGGLKVVEQDDGTYRTRYGVPEDFPPTNTLDTVVLLVEELAQASKATMNALLQLLLDKGVGAYKLPPNTIIVATGNRVLDRAGSNEIPSPVRNRLAQYELEVQLDDVVEYMFKNNYDPRVISFLRYRPNLLHNDDMGQQVILSPRSWEFVNRKLPYITNPKTMLASLASVIGQGPAGEFVTYLEIENKLPKAEAIIASPHSVAIPKEGHIRYAVTTMLSSKVDKETFKPILTYMKRLDPEYQTLFMKDVLIVCPEVKHTPEFNSWSAITATQIFGGSSDGTRTFT